MAGIQLGWDRAVELHVGAEDDEQRPTVFMWCEPSSNEPNDDGSFPTRRWRGRDWNGEAVASVESASSDTCMYVIYEVGLGASIPGVSHGMGHFEGIVD